ncbi:MAG: riboflavin synthase [Bacteroidetes bacterium]|nr:riboflavin synthase [Bacteroidota bacterium]
MFTGIVESLGKIISLEKESANLRIRISTPFLSELKVDQSISHNGVCLTVEKITGENYEVVAIAETLERSNLGELKSGDFINLERCMKIGDRLDGHMVQGHVDETAVCKSVEDKNGSWLFTFQLKSSSAELLVEKGSVSINGVSLTVVEAEQDYFSVAIIPYTFENTTFQFITAGTKVNIEFDIIGKYVKRILANRS